MARLWTCGFELQDMSATPLEWGVGSGSPIVGAPTISTTVHREGAASMRCNTSAATAYIEHQVTGGVNGQSFYRFYLYIASMPSATATIFSVGQSGYFPVHVRLNPAGTLQLRDAFNGVDAGSASPALSTGTWYRIELDVPESGSTAVTRDVIAYLDGTNFSGAAPIAGSTGYSRLRAGIQTAVTADLYIDDIAVNNTSGTAQNSLPGQGSVVHLHPDGAGDNNGFATAVGGTAGAANNYTRVDETTPDDATTYNETTATGTTTIDDFALQSAASAGIGSADAVTLVEVGARIGSDATTTASLVYRIKSQAAGTTLESASVSVAVNGWRTHKAAAPWVPQLVSYTDPQAGGAWTPALLDTAQIGYRGDVSQTSVRRVTTLWALVEFVPDTTPPTPLGDLADDFDDNVVDAAKWPSSYGTYSETGGRARVTCDTNYNAYASASGYTLEDSQARVQVYPPADAGATAEAWAQLLITSSTPGTDAIIEVNAATSQLTMAVRVGYSDPGLTSLTYDATAHAWMRIREETGSLYWETSADGLTWTTRRTETSPAWVSDTTLQVQLICHRDGGTPDYAEFDNFNITPPSVPAGTLLETITDTFTTDGAFDPAIWPDSYNSAGLPLPAQSGGRGQVSTDTGFSAYASAPSYTLASSYAFAEVIPPALGGASGDVYCQLLVVSSTSGTQLVFEVNVSNNSLVMANQVGFLDESPATLPYDSVEHAWLRIREDAGTVYWDTSADGRDWTNRHSDTSPAWVSDTDIQLQLLAHRDDGTVDLAEFDNVNTRPALLSGYTVAMDWASTGDFTGPYDDVTTDVLARGPVVFAYGRDQARQLGPPAVGRLNMTLCNADRVLSPENPDSPIADDLIPAVPIKVETVVDDVLYPLFRARIDDFDVHPDRGDRSVTISAVDDLALLQNANISTEVYAAQRTGALMHVVLDAAGWTGPRDIDLGATFVPWWWAEETDAFTAMSDLLASEGPPAIAYVGPDGTFHFKDRHHRLLDTASLVSQATFASRRVSCESPAVTGHSFIEPFEYAHGWRDIVNQVAVDVQERRPDSALSVVWESDETISLSLGESVQIEVKASDPFRDAQDLVSGTDIITTGAGTVTTTISRTSGQSLTITVLAIGGAVNIVHLQVRARAITAQRTVRVAATDSVSIGRFGQRSYPNPIPWAGRHDAAAIGQLLLAHYAQRRPTVKMRLVSSDAAHLQQVLERTISDLITIRHGELGLDATFHVENLEHTLTRMPALDGSSACGQRVHYAVLGCERSGMIVATNPFTFDVAGAGFDDGVFDPSAADDPEGVFIFDHPTQGAFDVGRFGT